MRKYIRILDFTSVFDSVTINLEDGKQFVIKVVKNSGSDIYVQKVLFNNSCMNKVG